jgi:hypothetical protein
MPTYGGARIAADMLAEQGLRYYSRGAQIGTDLRGFGGQADTAALSGWSEPGIVR